MNDTESPRKGRSNMILTYEKLEELVLGISKVDGKVDHLTDRLVDVQSVHRDHEVRIKGLELAHATVAAASASSKGTWLWVWGAILGVPSTITAIITLLKYIAGN